MADSVQTIKGTKKKDTLTGDNSVDSVNGDSGDDLIVTEDGNDLVAGDLLGNEWSYVNGVWVYDPSKINWANPIDRSYNDIIRSGGGNDVILGNGGHDLLYAGNGRDLINAGTGWDTAFGGNGTDIINLEDGNDFGEGGAGADTINAGAGEDIVYGDSSGTNLVSTSVSDASANSFDQFVAGGNWDLTTVDGRSAMTQNVGVEKNVEYQITFGLAANLSGGFSTGKVEVFWDGVSVGVFSTDSAIFEEHTISVTGSGNKGGLSFAAMEPDAPEGPEIKDSGTLLYYDKVMEIGGEETTVAAFAPGQAKLYQVIDGQLKVFDPVSQSYQDAGANPNFRTNAVGFNQEDDLIYGVSLDTGTDSLGNAVKRADLIAIDAQGETYRIGETPSSSFVGDFDSEGNLWTFHSKLNAIWKVDVDTKASGDKMAVETYYPATSAFTDQIFDIAYHAEENAFYAITYPTKDGANGKVVRIDLSKLDIGGQPEVTSIPLNRTLFGAEFEAGMARGAYGAVFLDGDGNLYFGLNNGDHDLNKATASAGAIYKVHADWEGGAAYAQFMSVAQRTGSNDGAVDPRSADAFAEVDTSAPFLIREPTLTSSEGGDDVIRGGGGDDLLFGGAGDDDMHGGVGSDVLHGDSGGDKLNGAKGDDVMYGGEGSDSIVDDDGNDVVYGGGGKDYAHGGAGNDMLFGGDGPDKLVGGAGQDTISGGTGKDHLWGGDFVADGDADVFVFEALGERDYVHDYEVGVDKIDLSSFGTTYANVVDAMEDKGWATVIYLNPFRGAEAGDRIVLADIAASDLTEADFIL